MLLLNKYSFTVSLYLMRLIWSLVTIVMYTSTFLILRKLRSETLKCEENSSSSGKSVTDVHSIFSSSEDLIFNVLSEVFILCSNLMTCSLTLYCITCRSILNSILTGVTQRVLFSTMSSPLCFICCSTDEIDLAMTVNCFLVMSA